MPEVIRNVKLEHIAAWRKKKTAIVTGRNRRLYEVGSIHAMSEASEI